jgi:hypothetical protein
MGLYCRASHQTVGGAVLQVVWGPGWCDFPGGMRGPEWCGLQPEQP